MIRIALSLLIAFPANALTISYPESGGKWVMVSDDTGRIRISDSQGFGVSLADTYGTVTDGTRTIRAHGGGYIYKALFMIERQRNEPVQLLCDGFDLASFVQGCTSSATIWLGAKNVCIGRNAVFNFHAASLDIFRARLDQDGTDAMARAYPPKIAKVFTTKWANRNLTRVTAQEIKAIMPKMEYCK